MYDRCHRRGARLCRIVAYASLFIATTRSLAAVAALFLCARDQRNLAITSELPPAHTGADMRRDKQRADKARSIFVALSPPPAPPPLLAAVSVASLCLGRAHITHTHTHNTATAPSVGDDGGGGGVAPKWVNGKLQFGNQSISACAVATGFLVRRLLRTVEYCVYDHNTTP